MSQQQETDNNTECPICLESFTETGPRVPRLLPCSHSFCEQCVKKILKQKVVNCPECRTRHTAANGVKRFPQNKYILSMLKLIRQTTKTTQAKGNKSTPAKNLKESNKVCSTHKKGLILYCKRDGCLKEICQMCKMTGHKGHLVVSIEEERSAKVKELESLSGRIRIYRTQLLAAKKKVRDEGEDSLKRLRKRKREQIKIYDDLIKQMQNGIKDTDAEMDAKVSTLDAVAPALKKFKETVDVNDIGAATAYVKTVGEMMNGQGGVCRYLEYHEGSNSNNKDKVKKMCGQLRRKEYTLPIPGKSSKYDLQLHQMTFVSTNCL